MKLGINGRFYGAQRTGVQRYAEEIAGRLMPDATLFLPAQVDRPAGLPASTQVVHGRLTGHIWEQIELPSQLRKAGCDTVLHMAGTAPVATRGHVLVIHDVLPLTEPEWFAPGFRIWRGTVLRAAAPRAARVVTVSEWARAEILRTLKISPWRVVVAPQGVAPFDRPAPLASVMRAREKYGLPGRFFLAVGADPRKNLKFLGEVFRAWRKRGSEPPPLAVVGDPLPHLFGASAGWPPEVDVRLLGHIADVDLHALYTAASALCFPSRAEGFGRPPLEALACGTPAVVADYGAAVEVLQNAARIVPLDANAWVDALMEILDPAQPPIDGRALTTLYHWDAAAAAVREACEEAAAEQRRTG